VIAVGNYEFFIERTVGSAGILPADFVRASRLEAGATKALASISHDSPYLWRRVDPADSGRKAAATRHAQPIWSPEVELVAKLWRSPSQLRASNAAPLPGRGVGSGLSWADFLQDFHDSGVVLD
jgi:hypothetical protein